MREPLTIAVVQPPCVPYDVAANARTHAATVRAAGARVVVFPELSLTGYELDAPAITAEDPRLHPIIEACAETGSLALVGAPVQGEAGRSHIGMLAIDGSGATVAYRKMWLGGAEPDRFSPGEEPAVIHADGWRLGLAICKDTGNPQHAADTAALGIDAYVAGALESAEDADASLGAPAGSRPTTTSSWRSRASPGQPAAATRTRPAARPSGRPMGSSSPRPDPRSAPSPAPRSGDRRDRPPRRP